MAASKGYGWLAGAVLAAAALLGGCAASPPDPEQQARTEARLQEILSEPLDPEEYGEPRRCISRLTYRDFDPIGDRYLVFEGSHDRLWLNELRGRCPGLRRSNALIFEMRGMQICDMDQFKITDWFIWSRYRRWPWHWIDGVPCTLGKFQPVTAAQVEAVRAALEGEQ